MDSFIFGTFRQVYTHSKRTTYYFSSHAKCSRNSRNLFFATLSVSVTIIQTRLLFDLFAFLNALKSELSLDTRGFVRRAAMRYLLDRKHRQYFIRKREKKLKEKYRPNIYRTRIHAST